MTDPLIDKIRFIFFPDRQLQPRSARVVKLVPHPTPPGCLARFFELPAELRTMIYTFMHPDTLERLKELHEYFRREIREEDHLMALLNNGYTKCSDKDCKCRE
ncbi:hypothetical protein BJ508DRAFT_361553 [Ascobolus immersus RN42]|uniref:Uncharacterized protein n=1 Tax=Ascobolus immersus RN42 TaxID=1160509 RepID=A0A3N4I8Y2_ASCIM|nr:hypothetical protein BJ508DRAFT_361553 [Ascobolus immersus RN42]